MSATETVESAAPEQPEVVAGELVAPPSEPPPASALERAAEAAMTMPDLPGRDEFLMLAMQARMLSMSGAAPKAVRNNPHLAFHLALIGRDLRVSPSAAMRLIDCIELQRPSSANPAGEYQLSLSPELINGVLIREGLGRIIPLVETPTECQAQSLGPDGAPLGPPTTFTWADAIGAGLAGKECKPGDHKVSTQTRSRNDGSTYTVNKCGCNQGYITYPSTMLWWRACAFAARRYFPQATLGIYTTEELGMPLDPQGRMLNPATVELPEGYNPEPPKAKAGEQPSDAAELAELELRISALPEPLRAELADKWKHSDRLAPYKLAQLPMGELNLVRSMVTGFESKAKRGGEWDADEARAAVLAAREAAEAPPEAAAPDTGDAAPEEAPTDAPVAEAPEVQPPAAEAASDEISGQSEPSDAMADPPPPRQADPQVATWVRAVCAAAPEATTAAVVAEVKALHHSKVDRELADRGWLAQGHHIDTRRMVLTAALVSERVHPEWCHFVACEEPAAEGKQWCSDHEPF